jgi:hypothetical protein
VRLVVVGERLLSFGERLLVFEHARCSADALWLSFDRPVGVIRGTSA